MNDNHISSEQMQLLVDGLLPSTDATYVLDHLHTCTRCGRTYDKLAKVDKVLRNVPLERVRADFTRTVLGKLNIVPKTPFLFRIAENLAYVFTLMIVLGIMLTVFTITGVVNTQKIDQTQSAIANISEGMSTAMNSFFGGFSNALQSYLPFVFGSGSLKIALMGTMIVGMLALADKFVRKRVLRH